MRYTLEVMDTTGVVKQTGYNSKTYAIGAGKRFIKRNRKAPSGKSPHVWWPYVKVYDGDKLLHEVQMESEDLWI